MAWNTEEGIEGKSDKFIFNVESWGQYEPKALVKLAIEQLIAKVDDLSKSIK